MGAWGYGLFQSDHDYDIVSDLTGAAGLYQMEEVAVAEAKAKVDAESKGEGEAKSKNGRKDADDRIDYSIYAPCCSHPEIVRKHLDSGVLIELIESKKDQLLAKPKRWQWTFTDPCYASVLLGACAMTLGCTLSESYIAMLKKVYTEGGLMPEALKQMRKALFGPNGFQNGVPYDFQSKGLLETMNANDDRQPNRFGFIGMNVIGPGGLFNTSMGDSSTSVIIKELRAKHNEPDVCGGCGVKRGQNDQALLLCARCKDRKYCGAECQKKHWTMHKKVCKIVKT